MIKSKTKFEASEKDITLIFEKHNMPRVEAISTLGNGEFNAAYKVTGADGTDYVLKISPPDGSHVLTYEKNMMESEVFWYHKMKENTNILIPTVYASDFSRQLLKASYFIMEMMKGEPLWAISFSEEEKQNIQKQKLNMLTQIHSIHNEQFGYRQTGLTDNWYEAIRGMVANLVRDCEQMGRQTKDGHRLLEAIDKHKELLCSCPCCMVNFDLWDSNVLYHDGKLCWIDPERSFFGDPVADFITQGKGQKALLSDKKWELEIYNTTAETPIIYGSETEIRYQIAVGYLALIEEVEKYVRYEPGEENYIRNTVDAREMYDMAFDILL